MRLQLSKITLSRPLRRLLWWCLLVLVLVPILLICIDTGSSLFGYSTVVGYGKSMEPVLSSGDAIWVKYMDPTEVKVGDIVTLQLPGKDPVTHRVIKVQSLSNGSYLLETKGDANQLSERWEIEDGEKVAVAAIRAPFIGYLLDFLSNIVIRVILIGAVAVLAILWIRRQRTSS